MPKARFHTREEREALPTISGHFTEREGLQRAYYDEPAVHFVKQEREKLKLDEKDQADKIKLQLQYQNWLAQKGEINGRNQDEIIQRSTSIPNQKT